MGKDDRLVRLKPVTIESLNEVNRLRTKEATRTKEIYAALMKDKTRSLWTPDECVKFLIDFYLKHRKGKRGKP